MVSFILHALQPVEFVAVMLVYLGALLAESCPAWLRGCRAATSGWVPTTCVALAFRDAFDMTCLCCWLAVPASQNDVVHNVPAACSPPILRCTDCNTTNTSHFTLCLLPQAIEYGMIDKVLTTPMPKLPGGPKFSFRREAGGEGTGL